MKCSQINISKAEQDLIVPLYLGRKTRLSYRSIKNWSKLTTLKNISGRVPEVTALSVYSNALDRRCRTSNLSNLLWILEIRWKLCMTMIEVIQERLLLANYQNIMEQLRLRPYRERGALRMLGECWRVWPFDLSVLRLRWWRCKEGHRNIRRHRCRWNRGRRWRVVPIFQSQLVGNTIRIARSTRLKMRWRRNRCEDWTNQTIHCRGSW